MHLCGKSVDSFLEKRMKYEIKINLSYFSVDIGDLVFLTAAIIIAGAIYYSTSSDIRNDREVR